MRIKVNPYIIVIVAMLFFLLSGIAWYLKIIPESVFQQIVGYVITFLASTALMLDSSKKLHGRITETNHVVRDHLRNHP